MIRRLVRLLLVAVVGIAAIVRGGSGHPGKGQGGSRGKGSRDSKPPEEQKPLWKQWKRWLPIVAVLFVLLGAGGIVVMLSGIVPIKASSGHWAITKWFLDLGKKRSVSTHTLTMKPPDLKSPWLALKGAGHFETACRPCHGSPGTRQPRIAKAMTPTPPSLSEVVPEYDPSELFYIVKHGIKFTGMPAWPALHRDDEVWAMTAFLLQLPELDEKEYRRMARGETVRDEGAPIEDLLPPPQAPRAVAESCARCHEFDGLGRGTGAFPKLAGQTREYLLSSLQVYASGARSSGVMEPIAAGLSPEAMEELADYYAELPVPGEPGFQGGDAESIERGRKIAMHGVPGQRIPACVACHGPAEGPRNPNYPLLNGQYPEYLILQLELFKKEHRGGTEYSHLMHYVAGGLSTEQMSDVAQFYASLPLGRAGEPGAEAKAGAPSGDLVSRNNAGSAADLSDRNGQFQNGER